jgi:hypothetical protein
MVLGSTQPLVKMSTRNIPGGKGGRCVRLRTSPLSRAECHETWEPKRPGTLWATPGLLRDSFTFTFRYHKTEFVPIKMTEMSIKELRVYYKEELYQCFSVFAVIWLNISVYSGKNFVVLFAEKSQDCGLVFYSLTNQRVRSAYFDLVYKSVKVF